MTDTQTIDDGTNANVVVSVDAMGGDKGPSAIVAGLLRAVHTYSNIRFLVHGPESLLAPLIIKHNLEECCTIVHAERTVSMDDKPSQVLRHGKDTSMWSAVTSVKDQDADACVSCGNTGALMAISMVRLRKLAGINRPAIAILWPSSGPNGSNVMLDVGADVRADENDLLQFALMGASYSRNGFAVRRPRVGLLNVGTEEHKGRAELKAAHDLIKKSAETGQFEFVGFVEGGDIPSDRVDVIVTDGFTGNVALKTAEGTAGFIGTALRQSFEHNLLAKLSAILAYGPLSRLKRTTDPRRVNGGVFLGLNGTVVKSHGAADATGVAAAVGLAYRLGSAKFSTKLAARVASVKGFAEDREEGGN
ncbi:phosphate acyltransferase PlsX [uncultured Planktomarina sp.]|jgi:glycerol-3-phosphate acyltransferase PlsX|uniref:phosphate acyltransferase PlsX n=1 Tax=uncultured Planktomarina sp. TaxID=1538529 RepID=UPI003261A960